MYRERPQQVDAVLMWVALSSWTACLLSLRLTFEIQTKRVKKGFQKTERAGD